MVVLALIIRRLVVLIQVRTLENVVFSRVFAFFVFTFFGNYQLSTTYRFSDGFSLQSEVGFSSSVSSVSSVSSSDNKRCFCRINPVLSNGLKTATTGHVF